MACENGKNESSLLDLTVENLFELQCIIKATNIRLSARCEYERRQIFAFAVGTTELGLYYLKDETSLPVIKRIPWFKDYGKGISALCFDPTGSWLLAASVDGSLYILPAIAIVGEKNTTNQIWSTDDITSFTSLNTQSSFSSPSALTWWQGVTVSMNIGIIGTEQGEIVFVNLENGRRVNSTQVSGHISNLEICHDDEINATVSLLITGQTREQWQLVLEHSIDGYVYPLDNDNVFRQKTYSSLTQSNDNVDDEIKNLPITRSRLQGLKQMSVEKLVIIKQKLAETRNRNLMSSFIKRENDSHNAHEEIEFGNYTNVYEKKNSSDLLDHMVVPTPLRRDVFLLKQYSREERLTYIRYLSSTNHATIHKNITSSNPLSIHKMPERCSNVLLTSQLFYTSDVHQRTLHIISRALSEIQTIEKSEFSPDAIICRFNFDKREEVISKMYIMKRWRKAVDDTSSYKYDDNDIRHIIPSKIEDINIELPLVDSCIVVTNFGVYQISLKKNLLLLFMDMCLERQELERANRLALVFGLNAQQLFEYAGDIMLSNQQTTRSIIFYRMSSKNQLLKNVLKFAYVGDTTNLLNNISYFISPPAVMDLTVAMRSNLSNLSIILFTENYLKSHDREKNKQLTKDFLHFLSTNKFYDEFLAVGITARSHWWNILHKLAVKRGMLVYALELLMKLTYLPSIVISDSTEISLKTYGLYMCISEPKYIQGMLMIPQLAKQHMEFTLSVLPYLHTFVLQRLIKLYDPTNVAVRPLLVRYKNRYRTTSRSSVSSQCDSVESTDSCAESILEETIETFIIILLTFIKKLTPDITYESQLMWKICSLDMDKTIHHPHTMAVVPNGQDHPMHMYNQQRRRAHRYQNVDFKRRLLSTGYSHSALVRNGNIYTWGTLLDGCLGIGLVRSKWATRFCPPEPIVLFKRMEIEIFSVSCGRCHTLAVTNNGVYSWGSNQYGQLGMGDVWKCPTPELITSLADEMITDAVAGQYHSVALTMDGRVFTWGWGVYGQLGHGNTKNKNVPTLVTALSGISIRHINAGHAHTLTLSTDGYIYVFGSNVFGQLGVRNMMKSSIPIKVNLQEKIVLIATKYFHNLAVSETNKLYTWGISPQVLRLQSQAYKKSKISEYWAKVEKKIEESINVNQQNDKNDVKVKESLSKKLDCANNSNISGQHNKLSNGIKKSTKGINIGMIKEIQDHFTPVLVDTSSIHAQIIQITTGCHHSALLTKDATVFTWGRNVDGQLGTGNRCDLMTPTALYYNPIFMQDFLKDGDKSNENSRDSENELEPGPVQSESPKDCMQILKAVRVCCGSDYTIAIQPGGTVLSWGNNSRAQLGRVPTNKASNDTKLFLLKMSKQIISYPSITHSKALYTPGPVVNIPSPVISYQSYNITPLANYSPPRNLIEPTPGIVTLHNILEYFTGIYNADKIIQKCCELKNYQAASKLALLDGDYPSALNFQFKAIKYQYELSLTNYEKKDLVESIKRFDEQIEKNLIDTLQENAKKSKIKMPNSKSLDTFQLLSQEELFTFDCQGGSEELCESSKEADSNNDVLDPEVKSENGEEAVKENGTDVIVERNLFIRSITPDGLESTTKNKNEQTEASKKKEGFMKHALEAIEFYVNELDDDSHTVLCDIIQLALNFWIENELDINSLEAVLMKLMEKLYYPLGLLIFCQKSEFADASTNENQSENKSSEKIFPFSTKFRLHVCKMLFQHIDKGKPTPEFIEMLSLLTAKNYGPPLSGYPGSSENKTSEQIIEDVIHTLLLNNGGPKPFIHIKDPEKLSNLLAAEEEMMVFTCGHYFPKSSYETEIVPAMEAELLTAQPLPLPWIARYLSEEYNATNVIESVCPVCIPGALQSIAKNAIDEQTDD